jgi:hypothetical protein
MNVIFIPQVLEDFENLVIILYRNGYFGFAETSRKYVSELVDDILTTLPERRHKPVPPYFDRYGKKMKYVSFRKNKHTTWYVFFKMYRENGKIFYMVRYITNNHVAAQYLER